MEEKPLHLDKDLQSDSPNIDWPVYRTSTRSQLPRASSIRDSSTESDKSSTRPPDPTLASNYPNGRKSLSGISARSFILGLTLGVCSTLIFSLAPAQRIWRPPFFLSALALFHFLEYYLTARYNTAAATINAFLLSQNGRAYNSAHSAAFLECIVTSVFFPSWQSRISNTYTIVLGLGMMIFGQTTRSTAMATAGTNFNHTVQTKRSEGHVLVTHGIYAYFRHPSYLGFFWWGIGTQVVIGNLLCFLAYTAILWGFFRSRIRKEEELLVKFFGEEYSNYKDRTSVWIPFIK